MAALVATQVSVYPLTGDAAEFFPCGKDNRDIICRRLKLVLTGQGGTTNTMGAAALGFNQLIWCSNMTSASLAEVWGTVVDPTANIIGIMAAGLSVPGDRSGTFYITVIGTAKLPG